MDGHVLGHLTMRSTAAKELHSASQLRPGALSSRSPLPCIQGACGHGGGWRPEDCEVGRERAVRERAPASLDTLRRLEGYPERSAVYSLGVGARRELRATKTKTELEAAAPCPRSSPRAPGRRRAEPRGISAPPPAPPCGRPRPRPRAAPTAAQRPLVPGSGARAVPPAGPPATPASRGRGPGPARALRPGAGFGEAGGGARPAWASPRNSRPSAASRPGK